MQLGVVMNSDGTSTVDFAITLRSAVLVSGTYKPNGTDLGTASIPLSPGFLDANCPQNWRNGWIDCTLDVDWQTLSSIPGVALQPGACYAIVFTQLGSSIFHMGFENTGGAISGSAGGLFPPQGTAVTTKLPDCTPSIIATCSPVAMPPGAPTPFTLFDSWQLDVEGRALDVTIYG
jgi:hypothetical protein